MSGLEIECLGGIRGRRDGRSIPIRGRRQRQLIALLVFAGKHGLSTSQILEEIYGDELPKSRETAVRVLVDRLRHALGGGIEHDGSVYFLHDETTRVDVWQIRDQLTRSDSEIDEALRALTSDLVPGVELTPRILAGMADFDHRRLVAIVKRASNLQPPDWDALRTLESLALELASQEDVALAVARAQYRFGKQIDALATLDRCRSSLIDDFGLSPGLELERVQFEILQHELSDPTVQEPLPASAASHRRGAAARKDRTMVGREAELASLMSIRSAARNGPGRLTFIVGDAGMGKSVLAEAFMANVETEKGSVRFGACDSSEAVGFAPFLEALPELREELDVLQAGSAETARLLFCRRIEILLGRLRQPAMDLVLVLENMHDADSQTLHAINYLLGNALPPGVFIVVTGQPGEPGSLWARTEESGRRRSFQSRLELGPMNRAEILEMVISTHPDQQHQRCVRLAELVYEQSRGIPLAAGALCRSVAQDLTFDARLVKSTVIGAIDHQIDRCLNTEESAVLSIAAVIGSSFALEDLERLSGVDHPDLRHVLDKAEISGLIEEIQPGTRYRFEHAIIGFALERRLPASAHRRLNHLLFTSTSPTDLGRLVRYLDRAQGTIDDAASMNVLLEAAAESRSRLAFVEAARLTRRALDVMPLQDSGRLDILIELAGDLAHIGDAEAAEVRLLAKRECDRRGQRHRLVDIAMAGPSGRTMNVPPDLLEIFDEVPIESFERDDDRHRFVASWARTLRTAGQAQRARELLDRFDEDSPLLQLERILLPTFDLSAPPMTDALAVVADSLPEGSLRASIRLRELWAALVEQRSDVDQFWFQRAATEVRNFGDPLSLCELAGLEVVLEQTGIRPTGVTPAMALEIGLRLGDPNAAEVWMFLTMIEAHGEDRLAELRRMIAEEPPEDSRQMVVLALIAAKTNDVTTSRRALAACVAQTRGRERRNDAPGFMAIMAEAAYCCRDAPSATEALRWLVGRSGQAVLFGLYAGHFGPVDLYIGLCHATLGDRGNALVALERAKRQAHEAGSQTWSDRVADRIEEIVDSSG